MPYPNFRKPSDLTIILENEIEARDNLLSALNAFFSDHYDHIMMNHKAADALKSVQECTKELADAVDGSAIKVYSLRVSIDGGSLGRGTRGTIEFATDKDIDPLKFLANGLKDA